MVGTTSNCSRCGSDSGSGNDRGRPATAIEGGQIRRGGRGVVVAVLHVDLRDTGPHVQGHRYDVLMPSKGFLHVSNSDGRPEHLVVHDKQGQRRHVPRPVPRAGPRGHGGVFSHRSQDDLVEAGLPIIVGLRNAPTARISFFGGGRWKRPSCWRCARWWGGCERVAADAARSGVALPDKMQRPCTGESAGTAGTELQVPVEERNRRRTGDDGVPRPVRVAPLGKVRVHAPEEEV